MSNWPQSHATWCHSKSCGGDCGHSSAFTSGWKQKAENGEAEIKRLEAENKRLEAFKIYVHMRLDNLRANVARLEAQNAIFVNALYKLGMGSMIVPEIEYAILEKFIRDREEIASTALKQAEGKKTNVT
jgi:hypothetical protein